MMLIGNYLKNLTQQALQALYELQVEAAQVTLNETKPEFEGDYTIVLFQFVKQARRSPEQMGQEVGAWMVANSAGNLSGFNVIKGFLNLSVAESYWIEFLGQNNRPDFGAQPANGRKVMVEYSSPNTNKPLHLGHLRNNFLGWSVAELYKWNGYDVRKTCIVNDRGVHICKSMLAWKKFGEGATPESTGIKGDHLVGDFYVRFENELRVQSAPVLEALMQGQPVAGMEAEAAAKALVLYNKLQEADLPQEKAAEIKDELKEMARNATPIMQEVRQMLLKWEQGDEEVLSVWRMMNGWVYAGFDETYRRIGSDFETMYYESDTYLLGKEYVEEGLASGVFYRKEDGSVWIDLTAEGLDEKLVLRKDGTSVYITQDIGLAKKKYQDYPMEQSVYVIGDEQNYHMHVLQLICKKLGMPFADGIHHLSYGMVDLPTGRMKSREGTVVDADDLCDEMEKVAADKTRELGKVADFTEEELKVLYHTLGMGALKFYLLRVDPKKRMVFNPEESIDFHGFTGPFIQYSYARIQSVLRKAGWNAQQRQAITINQLLPLEKKLIVQMEQFPGVLQAACQDMNPSHVANYAFSLAKTFNAFYTEHSIANAESEESRVLRLHISELTSSIIANAMRVLGIAVPARM
ncbi:MAG: arginine--tRNA ligase [Chitinophagaceae bacterium]|nr:arginine--tRNA ligase [Chitinophagaceae bacterium]